jgi:hypothetical protein
VAPYPDVTNIQEGYHQRIKNIDNLVTNTRRGYLWICKNKAREIIIVDEYLTIYKVNIIRDIFFIKYILKKYRFIYFHSIYNYVGIFWMIKKDQRTILDFHGIVPEETKFNGKRIKGIVWGFVERIAAKKVKKIIFVTESMRNYFIQKYNKSKAEKYIIPILAKNALKDIQNTAEFSQNNTVYFIYSGNIQKWQNIEQMLDFIEKHDRENYKYLILSREKHFFESIVNIRFSKIKERFLVNSVDPSELPKYYSIAHYGFLLRDDHILNRVANPTKMLEYLFYGIIPIVKLKEIGDFIDYESVSINDAVTTFLPRKSGKNRKLAEKILKNNSISSFYSIFE